MVEFTFPGLTLFPCHLAIWLLSISGLWLLEAWIYSSSEFLMLSLAVHLKKFTFVQPRPVWNSLTLHSSVSTWLPSAQLLSQRTFRTSVLTLPGLLFCDPLNTVACCWAAQFQSQSLSGPYTCMYIFTYICMQTHICVLRIYIYMYTCI